MVFYCKTRDMLNDFISLIFPQTCAACGESLYKHEDFICTHCEYSLPKTNFHLQKDNPVAKLFYGRTEIYSASAYYTFSKDGKVQHLIHQLKYKGQKNIGYTIGKLYGHELNNSAYFNSVNVIIPVPLYSDKQKKRGYNQSHYFAKGLAESFKSDTDFDSLVRVMANESQTKKSRYERWRNVETVFELRDVKKLEGKHLLLVDDVVTTGATLEACSQVLQQIKNVKISIATIAYANL